jgi:hypothetical protein
MNISGKTARRPAFPSRSARAVWALLLLQFVVFLVSCSSIECPVQNTVRTLYAVGGTPLADTLTVSSVKSDGKDTILLNRAAAPTSFGLPISHHHATDKLLFKTVRLAVTDTVWIDKEDIPHFESVDCGTSFFHQITGVRYTQKGIDSIVVNQSFVDYDPSVTHLTVYFKARP